MTSDRPYRNAPGKAVAIAELRRCAGTQFDRSIVQAFCRMLESSPDPADDPLDNPSSDGTPAARRPLVPA
jgi:HD-GYP domain-containing protein (c-di-GMP phosphodiesterase class II)